jgi:cold shock CspA family protein
MDPQWTRDGRAMDAPTNVTNQPGRHSRAAVFVPTKQKDHHAFRNLRFFNHQRSFGFITNDAGQDDFVHRSNLEASHINIASLRDGATRLTYEIETRSNGKSHAINLSIIEA